MLGFKRSHFVTNLRPSPIAPTPSTHAAPSILKPPAKMNTPCTIFHDSPRVWNAGGRATLPMAWGIGSLAVQSYCSVEVQHSLQGAASLKTSIKIRTLGASRCPSRILCGRAAATLTLEWLVSTAGPQRRNHQGCILCFKVSVYSLPVSFMFHVPSLAFHVFAVIGTIFKRTSWKG